ncbi:hypothetical protein N7536_011437 [Penicillium majusculum]|nr:hypothetical protein N7536_011437 [Penicillium majusculum]
MREYLDLCARFEQEHDFGLPLPTVIYFLRQDRASLLSRSRNGNMIAIDPLYPNASDEKWKAFRLAFNKIAMLHGGIPHINKTRDGAINHFGEAYDSDAIMSFLGQHKRLDPKGLFLNPYFRELFSNYL